MKTFDRKDVYSWSNCEEAKTYIGKTGYFNNDFEDWFDNYEFMNSNGEWVPFGVEVEDD